MTVTKYLFNMTTIKYLCTMMSTSCSKPMPVAVEGVLVLAHHEPMLTLPAMASHIVAASGALSMAALLACDWKSRTFSHK